MPNRAKGQRLLVADDDYILRKLIGHTFSKAGMNHTVFENGLELLEAIDEETLACVLDLEMPEKDGIECLEIIRKRWPSIEVIMLTSVNQATQAVRAIRAGAFDYITKPFDPEEFINTVRKAMDLSKKNRENVELRASVAESTPRLNLLGEAPAMEHIRTLTHRIGGTDNVVLITGESGTGKTLLARALHTVSRRASQPFISVSCPSLPSELLESEMFGHEQGAFSGATSRKLGRAELAHGGTLFLDEIGDMALELQPKLLTFLQEKSFYRVGGEKPVRSDVRIIAATNLDLAKRAAEGTFREDLFFRLNVLPIEMPPLRERRTDIPLLARHFIKKATDMTTGPLPEVDDDVWPFLMEAEWKGNIRELENSIIRACTLRADPSRLSKADFSVMQVGAQKGGSASQSAFPVGKSLAEIEKITLVQTLKFCGHNKAQAARVLGIAEKSIYNKMRKHGIG